MAGRPAERENCELGPLVTLFLAREFIPNAPRIVQANAGRLLIFALNRFVHLAAVDRDLTRRLDAQSHFVAPHVDDGDDDVVADDDAFVTLPGENKHGRLAVEIFRCRWRKASREKDGIFA
jgi:hypothetical protein